jgi:nucleoid DNA-binding protein
MYPLVNIQKAIENGHRIEIVDLPIDSMVDLSIAQAQTVAITSWGTYGIRDRPAMTWLVDEWGHPALNGAIKMET